MQFIFTINPGFNSTDLSLDEYNVINYIRHLRKNDQVSFRDIHQTIVNLIPRLAIRSHDEIKDMFKRFQKDFFLPIEKLIEFQITSRFQKDLQHLAENPLQFLWNYTLPFFQNRRNKEWTPIEDDLLRA